MRSKKTFTVTEDRILRLPEVKRIAGLGRSSILRAVQIGAFPAPVKLGPKAVGWRFNEVQRWIASRESNPRTAAA